MIELGYSLSSEELSPAELIDGARKAEEAGFTFSLISDHFHPWTNRQPHSPFVWNVVGAISQVTRKLRLGTGVTCPIMRISPAIVAQAAATSAVMLKGRFFLGVGTGEYLNEHITGEQWPPASQRLEMLEEAIQVIRLLWKGGWRSHRGKHFVVERARIFTLPQEPPPLLVAASKPRAAELASRCGDGLISFEPDSALVKRFEEHGGKEKPRYGQLTVCYAATSEEAAANVQKYWPNAGIGGSLMTDLRLPGQFEEVIDLMRPELATKGMPLGANPGDHLKAIDQFVNAGFDHVYIHQIGPNQRDFINFYREKVLPRLRIRAVPVDGKMRASSGAKLP
jgi:coenzyme F420-dependent glucose-6-phosphate dehydrogenase